jgi:phage tail-like protein
LLLLNQPAHSLWIAGRLLGDGVHSPRIRQMRLEYDHDGLLRLLPPVYRRDSSGRLFLERTLALFESLVEAESRLIDDLPRLFDPRAAPDQEPGRSWLDWVAGWLGFTLDERWSEQQRRAVVEEAFALSGRRGTVDGLKRYIHLYTGTTARIEEAASFGATWSLGESSVLGFTTMLPAARAQEAVLGTTAVLDRSRLSTDATAGLSGRDDIAHHFCVYVYAVDVMTPATLTDVRHVVEQEKPAHTTSCVCLIEPRMSVGSQARLGLDAIVGGPIQDFILGDRRQLGLDTALGDAPGRSQLTSRVGQDARVGWRSILV